MTTNESRGAWLAPLTMGTVIGAAVMYVLDPARGRKRRARLIDAVHHARRAERELVGKAVRDARHRVRGAASRARHAFDGSASADDHVLGDRIRSALGRIVSHPHAIEITVSPGRVVVRGVILEREAEAAISAIRAHAGARAVVDELERHPVAGSIPGLQGRGRQPRRGELWTPIRRVSAMAAGTTLVGYGLARRTMFGSGLALGGAILVARAIANRPFGHDIEVCKTINVRAPLELVFELWNRFDGFPAFMSHVRSVRTSGDWSQWEVDGPPGLPLRFEAEVTRREPNRAIAWRTLPDQPIEHEGVVQFEGNTELTRVHVHMTYRPPAGLLGHAVARVLGWDPKHRIDDDLLRMKGLLEDGHVRSHRHRVEIGELI
ncbi:MAG: SRPBCC family protein [Kofleriaceae bacterium]